MSLIEGENTKQEISNLMDQLAMSIIEGEDIKQEISNLRDQLGSSGADISTLQSAIGNMLLDPAALQRRGVLEWLSKVKCEGHHAEVVKARLEGTGAWLLQRQEIQDWLESEKSSILWIHGKAGSGKTVLSSRIIDTLSATHGPSCPVLFFYCNYKEQTRREANGILRALLKQISGKATIMDPELVSSYDRAIVKGFDAPLIDASSAESAFRRALSTFKSTYVVIDALDECEEAERMELVRALKSHVSSKDFVVKVLLTSRDENDLARMLSETSDIRINADDTALDIRQFVEIKIEECITNGEILGGKGNASPELRQDLVNTLVSKADGMFLWVKYQLEHIRTQGSEHAGDLRNQLGKLPRGLDETYSRILERIDKLGNTQKYWAYKTLKWITCATRPLEPIELLQATALEPGSSDFEPSKMSNIAYLIEACCHLITLDASQGVVRFVHYSAQEYLQSRPEFCGAQELVASICITSLGLSQEFEADERHYYSVDGIYGYAAENWQFHVKQLSAVSILRVLPLIRKIFSDAHHIKVWSGKYWLTHGWFRVSPSEAPAYLALCSFFGITAAVEFFLKDETTELDAKWYALRAAAAAGNQVLVQLFLDNQVDINALDDKYGNALQAAARHGQWAVAQLLLEKGANINTQSGEYGNALQAAAWVGNEAVVRLLLENGVDINAQGGKYGNALQAAAYYGQEAMVRLLLENRADINAQGGEYGNALQAAAFGDHEVVVRLLLESGANINAQGGEYGNALQAAATQFGEALVRLLLDNGADINSQGGRYGNALPAAAFYGREAVVRLLLESGADINARGGKFNNALQAAAFVKDVAVVRLLLEYGADINIQGGDCGDALQAAVRSGKEAVVQFLLENWANINTQGKQAVACVAGPRNSDAT